MAGVGRRSRARGPTVLAVLSERLRSILSADGGVIGYRADLRGTLARSVRAGDLERVLPRVYAPRGAAAANPAIRFAALMRHDPDAVLVGRAAARALWWPELPLSVVTAARRGHRRQTSPGYQWVQRVVPPDRVVVVGGLRVTDAALTVIDLIPEMGGQVIDEALRRGVIKVADLEAALAETPRRRGNVERDRLVRDSRDEPWSEAERMFHRILRGGKVPWTFRTNFLVRHAAGRSYLDVALPALKLGFEIDGRAFHDNPGAFVADRVRDLNVSLVGWHVHRLPAQSVFEQPEWVLEVVLSLARQRALTLGLALPPGFRHRRPAA